MEKELRKNAELSQTSVEVNLQGKNQTAREAALLFARNFDDLNNEDYENLKRLLEK
ncbi:hypothetical protein P20311_1702 [Pseudoalteromonas sp. BSi20311]|nr:hypothetical protein P20311_1702 [Pseudoalteromonas sp. BSi20311]